MAGGAPRRSGTDGPRIIESVDFWNPTTAVREATLVFDLRRLHPNILPTLFFTTLDTTLPMPQAVTGYTQHAASRHGISWLDALILTAQGKPWIPEPA